MRVNSDQRGAALMITFLIIVMLAILVGVFYTIIISNYSLATAYQRSAQAYYTAQAGVVYALYIADNCEPDDNTTWPQIDDYSIFGGEFSVTFTSDGENGYFINSTTVGEQPRAISVHIDERNTIINWSGGNA